MTTLNVSAGKAAGAAEQSSTRFSRWATLIYGAVCYAVFFALFLYAFGFVGNLLAPKSIDAPASSLPAGLAPVINLALIALFGLQHSVMARPTFKKWWTRLVPEPIERSTYVMATNLCFIALFAFWQPMTGVVWHVDNQIGRGVLWTLFVSGWLIVLVTTFMINHFDLFGLRQVWVHFRGRKYAHIGFRTPGIYKYVRHPLYVGWITAFWAIPTMTVGHLLFAAGLTAYILIAIQFEERNLAQFHKEYPAYKKRTGWFLPRFGATQV